MELETGFPITQSVIEGSQAGRVFHYNGNYFIVHKSGFCSLIQKSKCLNELLDLFLSDEIPDYFHIYNLEEGIIDGIARNTERFKHRIRNRIKFSYKGSQPVMKFDVENFICASVDESNIKLIHESKLAVTDKFWTSSDDFIKSANGVIVINEKNEAVCICYAAAIATKIAEIDIITNENYRGKGLAKFALGTFIGNCLKSGIIPNWDCFEENIASLNTAAGFSFVPEMKYKFMSIFKGGIYEN